MRHKVEAAGLAAKIRVDSAGTGDWHIGARPHRGTARELQRRNIDFKGITARQFAESDLEQADYLIVMDLDNYNDVRRMARGWGFDADDVRLLLEFSSDADERSDLDVPDPYYQRNFDVVYEMIDDACENLLKWVRATEKL